MRKNKRWRLFTILFPVLFMLGIVTAVTIPKGSLLKASNPETHLVDIITKEKVVSKLIETGERSTEFEIQVKEDGLYQIPYNENNLSLSFVKKNNVLPYYETTSDEFRLEDNGIVIGDEFSAEETLESTNEQTENGIDTSFSTNSQDADVSYQGSGIYKVVNSKDTTKEIFYLQLKAGEKVMFQADNLTSEDQEVVIEDAKDDKRQQTLLRFKKEAGGADSLKPESTKTPEQSSTEAEEPESSVTESTIIEPEVSDAVNNEETTEPEGDPQTEPAENSQTTENAENILSVETKTTQKSLEELTSEKYEEKDSLKTPVYFSDKTKKAKGVSTDSPIIINDAKFSVKTGTSSFDGNDNPGNDSSESNDIVRTFDQISYLVSFSIQNTKLNTKYTDIRYRVIAEMSDAVEMVNSVPINHGEIANGKYIDTSAKNGSQISKGVMESVISDSGQVFVPVILNVYGSSQGKIIKPTIKIEVVDAKNVKTGETEIFNKEFDNTIIPNLRAPSTKVSAMPSVGVELVRGEESNFQLYKPGATNTDKVYDVGVVAKLNKLSGRKDMKGATYPNGPIEVSLKQSVSSDGNATVPQSKYRSINTRFYSITNKSRNEAKWTATGGGIGFEKTFDPNKLTNSLEVPNGKTGKIYTSEPGGDVSSIGVYDSGSFKVTNGSYEDKLSFQNYRGVRNPYTYTTTGSRYSSEAFISAELIVNYYDGELAKLAQSNNWSRYDMSLFVDSVSYDNIKIKGSSSLLYTTVVAPKGIYRSTPAIGVESYPGRYNSNGRKYSNANPSETALDYNYGNAQLVTGQNAVFTDYASTGGGIAAKTKKSEHLIMWDATGFKFDKNRGVSYDSWTQQNVSVQFKYGVVKNEGTSPPYTMDVGKIDDMKKLYNWYDTPEAAEASNRPISAAITTASFDLNPDAWSGSLQAGPYIPVTVLANSKNKTPAGNPLVVLGAHKFMDKDNNIVVQTIVNGNKDINGFPDSKGVGHYLPTQFDASGNPIFNKDGLLPMKYYNHIGESAYVQPFAITTTTEVLETVYDAKDPIDIKLNGIMVGSDTTRYDSALTTTLPKGIIYDKEKPPKDAEGNELPKPIETTNDDGSTSLRWVFNSLSNEQRKKGIEVNFQVKSDISKIDFKDDGVTEDLVVKTVGEMWVNGNTSVNDNRDKEARSSQDYFLEKLTQQVILSKDANKPAIEVGDQDPIGLDNTITYTINLDNESSSAISDAKLLEVLPYNGDSRGTKLSGSYTVKDLKINDSSAKISYTYGQINEQTDPNSIPKWNSYIPGSTSLSVLKDAKAFLITKDILDKGKQVKLQITLEVKDQKPGDILVNNANMNSNLNLPVQSQTVWTNVYGRSLQGLAWYDDNLNGLKDGGENIVPNIPIKLYRTSQVNTSYKNELVKENLTGQKFIDASGNSLIKTDSSGNYKFTNLPEGEYVAYFEIGSEITAQKYKVTKKDTAASSQAVNTSKANPTTYKTDKYKTPTLSTGNFPDNEWKVENINLGLIRPGKIRLFKYSEGTAIDADKNGKLSDAEKATGTPLAGAVFDIYKGDREEKIGTATTKSDGTIEFDKLFPGDYTLVETKAPSGHELIKKPIKVTVTRGNQLIPLYLADNQKSDLPFTGGNGLFGLFLIIAGGVTTLGFVGILLYYRPRKTKGGR